MIILHNLVTFFHKGTFGPFSVIGSEFCKVFLNWKANFHLQHFESNNDTQLSYKVFGAMFYAGAGAGLHAKLAAAFRISRIQTTPS